LYDSFIVELSKLPPNVNKSIPTTGMLFQMLVNDGNLLAL